MFSKFLGGSSALVLALAMTPAAFAQEVSTAVRGYVTDSDGAAIANATVRVTHQPTGSVSEVQTNQEGIFYVRGLRVGGPYRVEASAPGLSPDAMTFANLGLGEVAEAYLALGSSEGEAAIVVTGARVRTNGPTTQATALDIAQLPSFGRDPKDLVRLDPFVTIEPSNSDAIVVAGQNSRFNLITVDGVRQNDDFGLNNNGYPTQRSPVSLDAVQGISVRVAPYSVRYNGFTGGNINLVTRSGGNDFSGSIFYEFTNQDFGADRIANGPFAPNGDRLLTSLDTPFETRTWGATLGGPILRDRLFFFLSYEDYLNEAAGIAGPDGTGRQVTVLNASTSEVDAIEAALDTVYNFDFDENASVLNTPVFEDVDEKTLARLDWNITDDHRASFTYQVTEGLRPVEGVRSTSTLLALNSHQYSLGDNLETYTAQLQSQWTDAFSTELIASRKIVDRTQQPVAGRQPSAIGAVAGDDPLMFGHVEIDVGGATVQAGPDRSRHSNALLTETDNLIVRGEYLLGSHRLMAGYEYTNIQAENLFAQDVEGRFNFNSVANLQAGLIDRLRLRVPVVDTNGDGVRNKLDFLVDWGFTTHAIYAEDSWDVTDSLTVLGGLRYEWFESSDRPNLNSIVRWDGQTFEGRYGFNNAGNLDGLDLLAPRLGFEWRAADAWRLSGGVGLFSGGSPNVWISNNYSNDGQTSVLIDCRRNTNTTACPTATTTPVLTNPATLFDVPLSFEGLANAAVLATESINALDPNFEPVSTWRANLALNYQTQGENPWRASASILYSQTENALSYIDARGCRTFGGDASIDDCQRTGTLPDGRPMYNSNAVNADNPFATGRGVAANSTTPTDLVLTNTDEGETLALAFEAGRSITDGAWRGSEFSLSYTYTDAQEVSPLTSSVAFSNYSNIAVSDVNNPGLATSNTEIEHSFKARASFERRFFGDLASTFSIFAEYRTGLPYSYTFSLQSPDRFGDPNFNATFGGSDRQLLYVPTGATDPLVGYSNAAMRTAFLDYVNNSDLSDARGRITERNEFQSPWVTRMDLRFSQELPGLVPNGARGLLYMDVLNFANLLNPRWGQVEQTESPFTRPIARATYIANGGAFGEGGTCSNATGCWQYSPITGAAFNVPDLGLANSDAPRRSLWQVKFGIRYQF
jgi:hypothetical protein